MRRRLAALLALLVVVVAAYYFLVRDSTVTAQVQAPRLSSTIGSGEDAIGVDAEGGIVRFLPIPEDPPPPRLALTEVPKSGHLAGPALEQAKVLGAAPAALRPYVESSYYGDSGVDVNLTSGIELRFGDDSQAARKWRAAAAVLANPEVTALNYVDLSAPNRPSINGEGHLLPPAE